MNHKRVARLMRAAGISGRQLRKGKCTTVQDRSAAKAPDLLGRDFTSSQPDVRWCGDIRTASGAPSAPPNPGHSAVSTKPRA